MADIHLGDGIDLCSNNNTVIGNTVFSGGQAGIHLDSSCGATGNNNVVSKNTVNDACAGILLGNGAGNTFSSPNFVGNVANRTTPGEVCTPGPFSSSAQPESPGDSQVHRPSPARP